MAYNPLIPQANDLLSQSQGEIQTNFAAIKTLIDINHVSFGATGEGKHFKVSLPVQSPAPSFSANEVGLYSFLNPTTSKNELYINKTNNSGTVQIPGTASILGTATPSSASSGWTYLPSGILVKWGTATNAGGAVALNGIGPNFTVCISVFTQVVIGTLNRAVDIVTTTAGNFTTRVSVRDSDATGVTATYNWVAIGY